jgi:hypothetical protein
MCSCFVNLALYAPLYLALPFMHGLPRSRDATVHAAVIGHSFMSEQTVQ